MKKSILLAVVLLAAICVGRVSAQNNYRNVTVDDEFFVVAEHNAEFPGGMDSLLTFLGNNLQYPDDAMKNKIEGTVYVSFVIERDGTISNAKVVRPLGYGCDEEVLRVVKMMPRWKPGYQKDKAVRFQYTLPVKFSM